MPAKTCMTKSAIPCKRRALDVGKREDGANTGLQLHARDHRRHTHTHTHFTLVFIPARQQAQTALVVPMMSQPIKSCLSLSLIFYLRLN